MSSIIVFWLGICSLSLFIDAPILVRTYCCPFEKQHIFLTLCRCSLSFRPRHYCFEEIMQGRGTSALFLGSCSQELGRTFFLHQLLTIVPKRFTSKQLEDTLSLHFYIHASCMKKWLYQVKKKVISFHFRPYALKFTIPI